MIIELLVFVLLDCWFGIVGEYLNIMFDFSFIFDDLVWIKL